MPRNCLIYMAAVWLCLVAAGDSQTDSPLEATDPTVVGRSSSALITLDAIQSELKALEANEALDDVVRAEVRRKYQLAQQHLEQAAERRSELTVSERMIETAAEDFAAAQRLRQEQPTTPPTVELPPQATLKQLKDELDAREGALKHAAEALVVLDAAPKKRATRMKEISENLPAAKRRLEELEQELTTMRPDPGAETIDPVQRSERAEMQAEKQLLKITVKALEKEREAYDATSELLQVQRDIASAEAKRAETEVSLWRQVVNSRMEQDLQRQTSEAERKRFYAKPHLKELWTEVTELNQRRKEVVKQLQSVSRDLETSESQLADITKEFERAKEKVAAGGLSNESGEILREQRASLPELRQYRRNIQKRQGVLQHVRFMEYEYHDDRLELADLDAEAERIAREIGDVERDTEDVRELLQLKRESLDGLIREFDALAEVQLKLNVTEKELINVVEEYSDFIEERVLWIRSAMPLNRRDIGVAVDAFRWLGARSNWQRAGQELVDDAWSNIFVLVPLLLLAAILLYGQKPLRRTLGGIGQLVSRRGYCDYLPTIRAFVITVAISLYWPAFLCLVAWRLGRSLESGDFCRALSAAMLDVAVVWFALEFLRQICRRNGLAAAHFAWPEKLIARTRRSVRWLIFLALPMLFLASMLAHQSVALWANSLGRVAFVLFLIVSAVFVERMLNSKDGLVHQYMVYRKEHGLYRFRVLWVGATVLTPLVLAVLALAGYYDTALSLSQRLFASACLLLALVVLNSLLSRWVLVRRRSLAMEQARHRRAALVQAAEESGSESTTTPVACEETVDEVDLGSVSQQTVQLLRTFVAFAGLLGLWLIWDEIVPALKRLEEYPAWPGAENLSLADVLLALVVLAITYVAIRDVPGVLEMTLLKYLPVDAGARFATKTICRYLIAFVGISLASQTVGISWKSLQWLVAAMGIGLGFGLQEIFANFISGIILLFERPIRVGDIVTLGDTTGIVTQIRMRATTITDWDRKEYVVPNKDLITGRLLNWTLSNQTNRIVITVGVAYGSETELARELLLKIARNHPLIMEDPEPIATFEGFGDSTLNLVLRCYLPDLQQRLATVHELHTQIDREFRRAAIEIAFPQRDLHIRSADAALSHLAVRSVDDGAVPTP